MSRQSSAVPEAPRGGRIGPGAFVAVVGPSGAGKDTLIRYAALRLAYHPDVVFVRRVITRPCHERALFAALLTRTPSGLTFGSNRSSPS